MRPSGRLGTACLFVGLVGLPEVGLAGTGRLLSQWMSRAPRIDGQIAATEWSETTVIDLGSGVTVRIGNDARTLYLGLLDTSDLNHGSGDGLHMYFDDEGGVAPVLDDDAYGSPVCQQTADLGEGVIALTYSQGVEFHEFSQAGQCPYQDITGRTSFRSSAQTAGVTYEAAIPLDGPAPLRAGPGERFGVHLRLFRDGNAVACLPNCAVLNPPEFRNLILASGGCNTGPQDFGSGDPRIGLPLDWTADLTIGSGGGWVQSAPPMYGDPVFCDGNDTGGSGAAACVANFFHATPRADARLRMPLSFAGQSSAAVRLRAELVVDPNGSGQYEYLSVDLLRQDGTGDSVLFWLGQDQSGTVELPLSVGGSPPVELWFTHSAFLAGGTEGGFAQIDDVELLCGPILFTDGFESGLTTHWSATLP